jgi:hypothetical protein
MENQFVLVHIHGGIAYITNTTPFPVALVDDDIEYGDDDDRKETEQNMEAYHRLSAKASEMGAKCECTMLDLEAMLVSPAAPVDWANELERLPRLRQEALKYLESVATKEGIVLDEDGIASFDDNHGGWGGQDGVDAVVYKDKFGKVVLCDRYEDSQDTDTEWPVYMLETSTLIEVCASVKKALEGGKQ